MFSRESKEQREARIARDQKKAINLKRREVTRHIEGLDRDRNECLRRANEGVDKNDRGAVEGEAMMMVHIDKMKGLLRNQDRHLMKASMTQMRAHMIAGLDRTMASTNAMLQNMNVNIDPDKIAARTAEMADHESRLQLNEMLMEESMGEQQDDNAAVSALVNQIFESRRMDQFNSVSMVPNSMQGAHARPLDQQQSQQPHHQRMMSNRP